MQFSTDSSSDETETVSTTESKTVNGQRNKPSLASLLDDTDWENSIETSTNILSHPSSYYLARKNPAAFAEFKAKELAKLKEEKKKTSAKVTKTTKTAPSKKQKILELKEDSESDSSVEFVVTPNKKKTASKKKNTQKTEEVSKIKKRVTRQSAKEKSEAKSGTSHEVVLSDKSYHSLSSDSDIELPMSAIKRLKKSKQATEALLKELNSPQFDLPEDFDDEIILLSQGSDHEEVIKIKYRGEILRCPLKVNSKFVEIFRWLAQKYERKISEVMLLLGETIVSVEDSPLKLKISPADILDCSFLTPDIVSSNSANLIKLKIQSNKTKTSILVHKLEPLAEMMQKYSQERNIPMCKLVFKFDGERIDPKETPFDLDMENGSCIDVIIM